MSDTPHLDKWREEMRGRSVPEEKPDEGPLGTIYQSKLIRVATPGSQRRCYDGCFHPDDWEMVWSEWDWLSLNCPESKLEFWRSLGDQKNVRYKWVKNT